MRTAVRYKVDASKITAGVTSRLSAKGKRGNSTERGSSAKVGDKRRSSNCAKGHLWSVYLASSMPGSVRTQETQKI
jgi:hypothetical protein